jgi:hypothetical protein
MRSGKIIENAPLHYIVQMIDPSESSDDHCMGPLATIEQKSSSLHAVCNIVETCSGRRA